MAAKKTKSPARPLRLSLSEQQIAAQLGPLAGLVGTWSGNKGWNLIAVPQGTKNFTLLIQPYYETLTIRPVGAFVPNRGGVAEQRVGALTYDLTIKDLRNNETLHVENGLWLYLGDIEPQQQTAAPGTLPPPEFYIARQANIPHGTAVIALGKSQTSKGTPNIPVINALPVGTPTNNYGYTDEYFKNNFPEFNAQNPNAMLKQALKGQNIGNVVTLNLSTGNAGGSIENIPFIVQHSNATQFNCTYWLEEVIRPDGSKFMQLQYSQLTMLDFLKNIDPKVKEALVKWPHVNVNTLVKQ